VHALTKSDLILRDLDTLRGSIALYAAVSFTITTADDDLGKHWSPPRRSFRGASRRWHSSAAGI